MLKPYLRFFRVVNLPTVPGDVLVGAAAVIANGLQKSAGPLAIVSACAASVFLYMFALADNDIVGAMTDRERPIPRGEISLFTARLLRALCLGAAIAIAFAAELPRAWNFTALMLVLASAVYNRTKWCLMMGLCRALNVWCGGVAIALCKFRGISAEGRFALFCTAVIWALYITVVTKYSEGEEADEAKKSRVGFLIGAIIYLQLAALLYFPVRPFLVAGALLLMTLRILKRLLPEVSAS